MKCILNSEFNPSVVQHREKSCLPTCTSMHVETVGIIRCVDVYFQYFHCKQSKFESSKSNFNMTGFHRSPPKLNTDYSYRNACDQLPQFAAVTVEVNGEMKSLMRSVHFTKLDLVICIGSIIGLFFGASLLSLVEIMHLWFLHRF